MIKSNIPSENFSKGFDITPNHLILSRILSARLIHHNQPMLIITPWEQRRHLRRRPVTVIAPGVERRVGPAGTIDSAPDLIDSYGAGRVDFERVSERDCGTRRASESGEWGRFGDGGGDGEEAFGEEYGGGDGD